MLMSYYDEFYQEPSEFEMQIDEFKQSLLKSVKDDYIAEMERLRAENAELQDVKNNFELIKTEYSAKERKLEHDRNDMVRKVRSERLSALMKDFEVVMYRADYTNVFPPKCEKCDSQRRVTYKTPLGKDAYEECECKKSKIVYVPEEMICKEFRLDRDGKQIVAWYVPAGNDDDSQVIRSSSTFADSLYHEGMKYEDIKRYGTFFRSKDDCQRYCDWLTEQKL